MGAEPIPETHRDGTAGNLVGSTGSVNRRVVLAAAAMLLVGSDVAKALPGARLVALDWALAEIALSTGLVPVAASEAVGYRAWVGRPELPPQVIDLGLRQQPNLELIQALAPDLILTVPDRADIGPRLERIAPLMNLPIYTTAFAPFARASAAALSLGERTGRIDQAQAYLAKVQDSLDVLRARLARRRRPPVAVIRFVDARTAFVFGPGGLFQDMLDRLGLKNGWSAPPSRWGYAQVPLTELTSLKPGVHLFYLDQPVPPEVTGMMRDDPLWHAMPFVRAGAVTALPTVWFFGAVDAGLRFATLLTERLVALEGRHAD